MRRADLLAVLLPVLAACGAEGRQVLAHYENGAPRSELHEVRTEEGDWVRQGSFRAWHENGELQAEGAFLGGEQDGPWSQYHENGQLGSEGAWLAGQREGPWRWWSDAGIEIASGSYLFGEKEGAWVHRKPDGSVDEEQSGIYEAGVRVAEYVVDGALVDRREGQIRHRNEYAEGVPHGLSTSYHADGTKQSEGRFEEGRKTGRWTFWSADGSVDEERSGTYDGWRRTGD